MGNLTTIKNSVSVTGGTGFIGRYLIDFLLAEGFSVRVLTRNPDKARALWNDKVEIWYGDLTVPDSLVGFMANVSIVYNLAGTIFESESFTHVNELGTVNLLNESLGHPIKKFVHLSSVGVVGPNQQTVVDENTKCNPANDYERSKLKGERAVLAHRNEYNLPITILRPTIVFGIGRSKDRDSFASWMQSIQLRKFRYIGNGTYIANYIYVEDVAAACIHVTKFKQAEGEIYNISDSCTLREFVETAVNFMNVSSPASIPLWIANAVATGSDALGKISNISLPLTQSRLQALTNTTEYSSLKLHNTLGFIPPIGYQEGLNRTISWYKEQGTIKN